MNEINTISGFPFNDLAVMRSVIGSTFFADYGIISAVNPDKTINVTHAVLSVKINGEVLDKTETYNVEVIYPASASFGQNWPLAVGDGVLLVGLKNYVESTNGIAEPEDAPTTFPHYTQNTMKAIPLQSVTSPKITINVNGTDLEIVNSNAGGLIKIATATKSLKTHLSMMETALNTFMGPASQAAITAGGSSSGALASAIVALMSAYMSSTATLISDLNSLLKA